MTRILILGGTKEAAELAAKLVSEGHEVTTSLAGRTKEPAPVAGTVRTGGFGGVAGLIAWLGDNGIDKLIDATHPFAVQISSNAARAAAESGIEFELKQRAPWQVQEGDTWQMMETLEEAAQSLPSKTRVLLALGSQHLAPFADCTDIHFVIRMIDPPKTSLPFGNYELVLARPSADWREEADLLTRKDITHIVARNSGGNGAYAKIEAARKLGLPVIMIERPGSD